MKAKEVKNLSVAELQQKLAENQKAYTDLKMAHAVSPIQNPLQIRTIRRTVARLATELNTRAQQ
jgi:large subunit ribosomal protein L29